MSLRMESEMPFGWCANVPVGSSALGPPFNLTPSGLQNYATNDFSLWLLHHVPVRGKKKLKNCDLSC